MFTTKKTKTKNNTYMNTSCTKAAIQKLKYMNTAMGICTFAHCALVYTLYILCTTHMHNKFIHIHVPSPLDVPWGFHINSPTFGGASVE